MLSLKTEGWSIFVSIYCKALNCVKQEISRKVILFITYFLCKLGHEISKNLQAQMAAV